MLLLRRVETRDEPLELAPSTPFIECHTRISAAPHGTASDASIKTAMRSMRRRVYIGTAMAANHERSAAELAQAYSSGELSPLEAARASLERIERWEPRINAMYRVHRESGARAGARLGVALARAPLLPDRRRAGHDQGEHLHAGRPGADRHARQRRCAGAEADAPAAARVREAGCVILGKTTMPDFGMLSSGVSSLHGVTRNPWRLDRNTSGSSSGAGAGRGRVCAAAPRHRHRRLGAIAGNALRHLRSSPRSAACRCTRLTWGA